MKASELLALDVDEARRVIVDFVSDYVSRSGAKGVVVGLSGGVDSSLVASLAAEAVGNRRVMGLLLPERSSRPADARDANRVASKLGIRSETVSVQPVLDATRRICRHRPSPSAVANLKARARMLVLYQHANSLSMLVAATGNKSEILTGYFTKHGDGAGDIHPIGDLYKTQVWLLAKRVGVSRGIVLKPPTAGLWAGQTDEAELGIRYAELDRVLACIENGFDARQAARISDLPPAKVARVFRLVKNSQHKRAGLIVPKIGFRTPGLDWRVPASRGA